MRRFSIPSEVGRLHAVLMHTPGAEIERMLPSMMGELLFDDILHASRAQQEHRRLQRIIAKVADEVLLLRPLLEETLEDGGARGEILEEITGQLALPPATCEALGHGSAAEIAGRLIEGILRPGITRLPEHGHDLYLLPPLPNLLFLRDPAMLIGPRAAIASMATRARLREPQLLRMLFRYHPRFAGTAIAFETFDADFGRARSTAHPRPSIEGGDLLVVRRDLLVVGSSVRTARATIEALAAALAASAKRPPRLLIVELPLARTYMHLDTVFTLLDAHQCLVYEPVVVEGGAEQAAVYELKLTRSGPTYSARPSLLSALKQLQVDLEPIPCGGAQDPVAQQREQWTDGANAFALKPGVVLLYERNQRTADALSAAGYGILTEEEVLRKESSAVDLTRAGPTVVLVGGQELSRARGGPRCLTLPLSRDH